MKKGLLLFFVLFISLVGCSSDEPIVRDNTEVKPTDNQEFSMKDLEADDIVGHIANKEITAEDLLYEMKRLELIEVLGGNDPASIEVSPKVAMQELIRNYVIHEIAQGENITVDANEQQERAQAVRKDVEKVKGYEEVMKSIDEELFWSRETDRYEIIIEAEKLIANLMEKVKENHPSYNEQALRFDAQKDLDEWIQEKTLDIEIHIMENLSKS